jgi:Tfp pilus assembly ATPase PilU
VITRTRTVSAQAVFEGRADLRAYPYRHRAIITQRGVGAERVSYALAAAEVLAQFGWDLVTISEFAASNLVYAFMRRRDSI